MFELHPTIHGLNLAATPVGELSWLEEMVFLCLDGTSYVLPISSFCCGKAFC